MSRLSISCFFWSRMDTGCNDVLFYIVQGLAGGLTKKYFRIVNGEDTAPLMQKPAVPHRNLPAFRCLNLKMEVRDEHSLF